MSSNFSCAEDKASAIKILVALGLEKHQKILGLGLKYYKRIRVQLPETSAHLSIELNSNPYRKHDCVLRYKNCYLPHLYAYFLAYFSNPGCAVITKTLPKKSKKTEEKK